MFHFVFYWSLSAVIEFWAHEILTIKTFGPKKYPREKILDAENTHEENI